MADLMKSLQGFFGGAQSAVTSATSSAADAFEDFATAAAASPSAPSHAADSVLSAAASNTPSSNPLNSFLSGGAGLGDRPYTKWYRVWERVTIEDFYQELFILPVIVIIVIVNMLGAQANKRRAKKWAAAHLPILESEFASVGFGGGRRSPKADDVSSAGLAKATAGSIDVPEEMLREKTKSDYTTYATGRQNVAFLHVKISLYKRYNPLLWAGEYILSFFFDSMTAPSERLEATAYCFDGREKALVPQQGQGQGQGSTNKDSTFDGFVFAIVHKDKMKQIRDDRYDVSLTTTRDHPKLPEWATVMSESAEVTEALLTPALAKAVTDAGEDFEVLIISDQPIDAPKKLNDTVPKKRVSLAMKLNSDPASTALFQHFLRIPDQLVATAHFRPEAMRKIKATREEEIRKIRKVDEDEKAEERRTAGDRLKKEERERRLNKMGPDEQKKFLAKEKEQEQRKMMKKKSQRG